MITATIARERVRAGAAHLDEHCPGRWWLGVSTEQLAMENLNCCVLGQLYGDFNRAPWWRMDASLGFTVGVSASVEMTWKQIYESYAALTQAWIQEVNNRKVGNE